MAEDSENTTPANEQEPSLEQKLENALKEAEKFKAEYLYLYAEFENYKKHATKDRADLRKYGCERLLVDLISVLDVFDTALQIEVTNENFGEFKKGVEMTATNLQSLLQRHGVEEVPGKGTVFNPAYHEALTSEPTSETSDGNVLRVFKRGFKLHDRVIRPGQVVVATKPVS